MRLEAQQARRIGEHRPRVRRGESLAAQHVEKHLGVAPAHVGVRLTLRRAVAEVSPAVDDLLGRAATDAELQPSTGDKVRRAGVLRHIERVFVAHVDDRRADLDPAGFGANRREQRKRRGQLAGEMMHAEVSAVSAEFLGGDCEFDGLQQRVRRRTGLRLRRRRPVAERQKADLLQGRFLGEVRRDFRAPRRNRVAGKKWRPRKL